MKTMFIDKKHLTRSLKPYDVPLQKRIEIVIGLRKVVEQKLNMSDELRAMVTGKLKEWEKACQD